MYTIPKESLIHTSTLTPDRLSYSHNKCRKDPDLVFWNGDLLLFHVLLSPGPH